METIYNSNIYNFGSGSALHLVLQYEKQRSGADMQYRFYYQIYIADRNGNYNPYGSYNNNLRLTFTLNGNDVWYPETGGHSGAWSKDDTSGWITISNKTSGTTPLVVKVDDTINPSWCHYTSGTFNLAIDPAGSDLGAINNFNIGTMFTVPITKYASMYDVLTIKIGNTTIKTIENASTSNQINFTQQELNAIYGLTINDASKDFTFELKTYENSSKTTQVGITKTKTAKGYIVGANPVINSVDIIDTDTDIVNNLTGDNTKLVMYHSTAKISASVSGIYQANISYVKINGTNATYNQNTGKWELEIENVITNQFDIEVKDSRGFNNVPNPQTYTTTKIDYIPLTANTTITRNQPTDGKVNVEISGNYFNGNYGLENNNLIVKYRYKEYGGSYDPDEQDWLSLTPTITNNTYNLTAQLSNFDYQKQYEFQVKVYDLLEEQNIIGIPLSKGIPTYNWGDDFFNINGELRIFNQAILTNLYPVGSIYMSVNNTNPSTYFGGTWVAWGSGRVPVGVNTSDSDFNTVEKTGGSKALQKHSHTGTTNGAGGHNHQVGADDDGAGGSSWSTIHKAGTSGAGRLVDTSWVGDHTHTFTTDNAGSGNSGNLQPYITCFMFKRTA